MADNFKCDCGKTYFVHQYTSKTSGYFDKYKKELLCSCGKKLIPIPKSTKPFLVNVGKFQMASREDKNKMLKQRSKEHFKKEIKPYKDETT